MTELLRELPLKSDAIKIDPDSLKTWGKDWTTYFDIKASAVIFPSTTEEVRQIVLWARRHKVALVPSGGRTGLSGAACATNGEVVVSFDRMNRILDFNPIDQTVLVEAGVITENLQKYAAEQGLYYPVDFAARGSSQIGGNVATNAGGIKVVRYGMTRDWIAGLTVVTGTGEVLYLNRGLIKNATGYDLRHLFIGSEGTLGFVTEVLVRLASPPPPLQVLLLACPDLQAVMEVYREFKTTTTLVAFEMFSQQALNKVIEATHLPPPFASQSPFYVVLEVEKRSAQDEEAALSALENAMSKAWITDGNVAQSETQARTFWRYREDIGESLARYSPYKNDISVAISKVPDFVPDLDRVLATSYPDWEVIWFGHIGDGNLHINILRPPGISKEDFVRECRKVDELVFAAVQKHGGSISAEHGVGLTKKSFLIYSRSQGEIEIMRGIKKVFDPDNILNPGKLI
ncbi:MAG: FAD-binding oxidoreductase [Bdellovibrionaceae bacterium]|nr:FAD-binding oxidoreductase [Pseudobdellovibrionaceae bacterium]